MKKEKKFFIPANNIKDLLTDWNEAGGCFASDRITVDGLPVGYMYREIPDGESPFGEYDSGWRFFAGDEDDEYANNPENLDIYRSCFEFLQKVFLGLMYSFSCVLWAIFWSFSLLFFVR